jgi:hypothetical protein
MWQKLLWRKRQTSSCAAPWTPAQSPTGSSRNSISAQHAYVDGNRVGCHGARILGSESKSRYIKYNESAHKECLTNPISQPSLDISPIWIPSSAMRLLTHRDLHEVTDSSWVSIRFQSRVFRFYAKDGASGRYYMSSQIFFQLLALGFTHLIVLARFVAQIFTSFSLLLPRMCVLYYNFYCIFSWYIPLN